MRRLALIVSVLAAAGAFAAAVAGADDSRTYKIEMYNAFGIVEGSEVRVVGVPVGAVEKLGVNDEKRAVIEVKLSGPLAELGEETTCSSEPQSLIAEYFIDCRPKGEPLPDGGTIPASQVRQTVQNDLVLNTMRLPFRQRFQILINEFGTALAGNPENLNEAIRLGAPALRDLHSALKILADQNTVIRQLNVDSDEIIAKLEARSGEVVRFIQEAGDAAAAAAERRDDLSTDFDLLDDALAELGPTMRELRNFAVESTPLLADLRRAAPGLNTLATNLPAFARASERSLVSLGRASVPGRQALRRARDEIAVLADSGRGLPRSTELMADFFRDIDDPRRAVEQDTRSARSCNNRTFSCWSTGRRSDRGYTGMEGLLNYLYYQAGALNQFDSVGHLLHFSLYDVFAGKCGHYLAGPQVPAADGGETTNILEAAPCVGWLGPSQPDINEPVPGKTRYDDSVCPDGSTHPEICDPNISINSSGRERRDGGRTTRSGQQGGGTELPGGGGGVPDIPLPPSGLPGDEDDVRGQLEDVLGMSGNLLDGNKKSGDKKSSNVTQAADDLLDFLFKP